MSRWEDERYGREGTYRGHSRTESDLDRWERGRGWRDERDERNRGFLERMREFFGMEEEEREHQRAAWGRGEEREEARGYGVGMSEDERRWGGHRLEPERFRARRRGAGGMGRDEESDRGFFMGGAWDVEQGRMRGRRGPYYGRGPKGWTRSNERLLEDICEDMADHGFLDASDIEIKVQNGEVTLSGTVPSRVQKRLAERITEIAHGVRDVHNHLTIRHEEAAARQTREALTGATTPR